MTGIEQQDPRNGRQGRRGSFVSREAWREAAAWSAIAFVTAAGITALLWAYLTDGEGTVRRFAFRRPAAEAPPAAQTGLEPIDPEIDRDPLDGAPVDGELDRQVYAVVIDNIDAARPQAGIADARLVIEAPVEGGITRLLAFFTDGEEIGRIGPVRSARPYFQDWAEEHDAVYAHVGGSPEALERLRAADIRDLNQYFWGAYFWRDKGKSAPHNVYTSTALIARAVDEMDVRSGEGPLRGRFGPLDAGQPAAPSDRMAIDLPGTGYDIEWVFDPESATYARRQGNRDFTDENGSVVHANTVVVHFTTVRVVDDVGRRQIRTEGSGRAIVMRDGRAIEGEWRRDGAAPARYTASSGPILLEPGVTWMEVVPEETPVTY